MKGSKCSNSDDEHSLIARYAGKLATPSGSSGGARTGDESSLRAAADIASQEALIQKLLQKNKQIAGEIEQLKRLRQEDAAERGLEANGLDSDERRTLCADLLVLKQHKHELEEKMGKLRDSRRDLVEQLESLMRLLRARGEAAALSSSLARRSPEHPRIQVPDNDSDPSDAVRAGPRSPCLSLGGGGGVGRTVSASQNSIRAYASLVSGELFGAVGDINAAVAELVKEITVPSEGA